MNSHDREKLLKEILPQDDLPDFRRASLECGLTGLRRERRRRLVVRFGAVAAMLVCVSLGLFLKTKTSAMKQSARIEPVPAAAPSVAASHVDFINDDQLLALFTNQPVALVGKHGEQRLVFLGKSQDDPTPHQY